MPKTIVRCACALVCLGLLLAAAPVLNSAARANAKASSISMFARQPLFFLASLFPALPLTNSNGQLKSKSPSSGSRMTYKPTGDAPIVRPSGND